MVPPFGRRGYPVDATDNNDWTALHYAAAGGAMDVAHLLIEQGGRTTLTIGDVKPVKLAPQAIAKELEDALAAADAADAEAAAAAQAAAEAEAAGEQPPLA